MTCIIEQITILRKLGFELVLQNQASSDLNLTLETLGRNGAGASVTYERFGLSLE